MADEKAREFILKLCDKTLRSEITWSKTANEGMYQAAVGSYIVRIYEYGDEGNEKIYVSLKSGAGELLDTFNDEEFDDPGTAKNADSMYRRMNEAYQKARRSAMGVDKALDELLKELD